MELNVSARGRKKSRDAALPAPLPKETAVATSVSVKICVADLATFQLAHPLANRSTIVRALIFSTAALDGPLSVASVEAPRAALWTSISMDAATELLLNEAFKKNAAKSLSAIIYHAVRDERVLERANGFLNLSEGARRRKVEALVLDTTGQTVSAVEDEETADAEAPTVLLSYLTGEVTRTEKELERVQKAHDAAKTALLAYRRTLGDDRIG